MTPTISSKLPLVGTTIFSTMSALATQHQAINLGQGFPDFPMDATLIEYVAAAMRDGHNQYAPMPGWMPLREKIAAKVASLYGTNINPADEITITPGGTYAIYTAFTSFLQPGDEVIVFEPAYDSYIPNIELNGAKAVCISLQYPDYSIPWNQVEATINSKTRAIIINTPHNPTGTLLQAADMETLQRLTDNTNILIISDEVYEHLIFDGETHHSVLRYPALRARSFACFSVGKVYHCTGWKMGYCIAPPNLMTEFRKVHQFNCFTCHTPSQVALAKFMDHTEAYLGLGAFLQQKRDFFVHQMAETRFTLLPSKGSYFIGAKYDQISNASDQDFAIQLIKEAGVATIPVSAFYRSGQDDHVLRFCFAKKEETLAEAVERLKKV